MFYFTNSAMAVQRFAVGHASHCEWSQIRNYTFELCADLLGRYFEGWIVNCL